jgi:RNA polymerase-binding transcription factor DksA
MDKSVARELLRTERAATLERIRSMSGDFDGIVAASADTNADDEHDPEGPTIAFERAQVAALLTQARTQLEEIEMALVRLADGTYAVCERCGRAIAAERLAARPAVRTCIRCATSARRA